MTRMLRLMVFSVFLLSSASWAQLITIDAQKDAYYDNITCPSEGHVVIPPEAFIASNGDMPTSPSDLSAKSWLAWDEDYLYYYEERLDDGAAAVVQFAEDRGVVPEVFVGGVAEVAHHCAEGGDSGAGDPFYLIDTVDEEVQKEAAGLADVQEPGGTLVAFEANGHAHVAESRFP